MDERSGFRRSGFETFQPGPSAPAVRPCIRIAFHPVPRCLEQTLGRAIPRRIRFLTVRMVRKGEENILPHRFRQVDGCAVVQRFGEREVGEMDAEGEGFQAADTGKLEIGFEGAPDEDGVPDHLGPAIVTDGRDGPEISFPELKDVLGDFAAEAKAVFGDVSEIDSHGWVWDDPWVQLLMHPKLPGRESDCNDIEPEFLLKAYQLGVFPMAMHDGEIAWFSPDPRGIIPLETFHVPHGLKRVLRKESFEVRVNAAFAETMAGCADRASTWIDGSIFRSYQRLHEMGFAHSVEAWQDGRLVGGLYGVALGGAFFGESMFSRVPDASKVALVHLVGRMKEHGFLLLDTQWSTPHLRQFGCEDIPRSRYMRLLERALAVRAKFVDS